MIPIQFFFWMISMVNKHLAQHTKGQTLTLTLNISI